MKNWILATALLISAQAAMADLKGEDFNQMIQENQKAEQQLRQKLQKDAGITFNDKIGQVDKSKVQAPTEAEQVVVSSGSPVWKDAKKDRSARTLQKAEMKRLSQELSDADAPTN